MSESLPEKIRKLNERIYENHRFDENLFKELTAAQRELKILDDERPFCPFLRPHFFERRKYERIARAAEVLNEAFERMTEAALENREILAELDLNELEEQAARIEPRYKGVSNSSRLDAFLDGDDFKF